MLQSPPSTSGARPPTRSRSIRAASRRAWSMMAAWLRSDPGPASSAYLPASTTPRSSAPSSPSRRCRPASRSASGALAQPGTLDGAGGRRPRLDGADTNPLRMPNNYQTDTHQTGAGSTLTCSRAVMLASSYEAGPAASESVATQVVVDQADRD